MKADVEASLRKFLSPEQIVGLANKENRACVSVERIYQHVWADKKQGGELYLFLRSKGKCHRKRGDKKDKRGQIVGRVSIENRPVIVENRERFGDLEIDTIIGKDHQGAIVTINDRATGYLKMKKLVCKEAERVKQATLDLLAEWKGEIHTMTADNGKEFAQHQQIAEALDLDFYFARPYHSWERGSNENLNGLIRQFIPKKTDFKHLSDEFIQEVQDKLNQRPRKRLDYDSPEQKVKKIFTKDLHL